MDPVLVDETPVEVTPEEEVLSVDNQVEENEAEASQEEAETSELEEVETSESEEESPVKESKLSEVESRLQQAFQDLLPSVMDLVMESVRSILNGYLKEGKEEGSEEQDNSSSSVEEESVEEVKIDFEETDLTADLKLSIEEVIQNSTLSDRSRDRVRADLSSSRLIERALEDFGGGLNKDEVISKVLQEVSSRIEGELLYLEEVAPAVVKGNGPRSRPTRREPDIDGVLESYGLVKN